MKNALSVLAAILVLGGVQAAQANVIQYWVNLSGPNESPSNASPGTGLAVLYLDNVANTLSLSVSFTGLTGPTTASHIHCCTLVPGTGTAGVATTTPFFTGFPIGVTSGTYSTSLDLLSAASYNPSFITAHTDVAGAEAFLISGINSGEAYLNIHTTAFPGGEIRGFLRVPEPVTLSVFGVGLAGMAALRKRRKAKA